MSITNRVGPRHSPMLIFTDPRLRKAVDVLYLAVFRSSESSMIPELYSFLGRDRFQAFMEQFEGMVFKCPTLEQFSRATRDAEIYAELSTKYSSQRVADLGRKHRMTGRRVLVVYHEMCHLAERFTK